MISAESTNKPKLFRIQNSCFLFHPYSILLVASENVQDFLVNKTLPGCIFVTLEIYVNNTFKPTRHHLLSSCFYNG